MYRLQTSNAIYIAFGLIAFPGLSSSLAAQDYTYTYTGPAFTYFDNNSSYLPPITDGNVDISITLDEPVLSNGVLTNYTPDVDSFSISDGQELLDHGNATIDAYFGTTNGSITDWTITATAYDLGPNEDYYQIDSETNTGLLNSGMPPFYSDIAINVDDSLNFSQGKAGELGPNPSPFVPASAPEPSTEVMLFIGVLPFLTMAIARQVRKRKTN